MKSAAISIRIAALLLLAVPALAADRYVDAVNGDDSNGGTSWNDAWRTLTHAVGTGGSATYHLARGVHDAALGEVFPIELPNGASVVGELGSALTILDGGGSGTLLRLGGYGVRSLKGLWLRNAGQGIYSGGYIFGWTATDVRISDMSAEGVSIFASTGDPWILEVAVDVLLDQVHISNCGIGVLTSCGGDYDPVADKPRMDVTVVDSEIAGCGVGLVGEEFGWASNELWVRRCRIHHNGTGVLSSYFDAPGWGSGWAYCSLQDSVLAHNQIGCYAFSSIALSRCTVAWNTAFGALSFGGLNLVQCVVHGNGDDLRGSGFSAANSEIGDGDFAGTNGNFSADPLFVDPAGMDFRLGWGSPCLEVGLSAGPEGLDVDGRARPLDGDLDMVARPDIGAYELATLDRLGGRPDALVLELFGEPGGTSQVFFRRGALLVSPSSTPFGDLYLDRAAIRLFANVVHSGGSGPAQVPRLIAVDTSLAGMTLGFQALSPSVLAPAGLAFTTAVEITIQ